MSDVARNAILEGKPLPGHLNASVIWNKPICNSKGHGIPKSCFYFVLFYSVWHWVGDLCAGLSLPWLGSVWDVKEPLRNAEAAVAVIKSLGGSPANAAFSNGFDDCMLFFQPD